MRVLVIDDEPDVLLLCRVNFEWAGHEILEARDGNTGVHLAKQGHPDVIVLDVMLPHKDGFETLSELRTDPEVAAIPVILLTAKTQSRDRLRGFQAGASEYVTKPFSPSALTSTVQRIADMSAQERDRYRERAMEELEGSSEPPRP